MHKRKAKGESMLKVGVLTAGSDCPGLNAALRAIGKVGRSSQIELIGFQDGFLGLIENRTLPLQGDLLSGILTSGGTILGTSRVVPHTVDRAGECVDLTDQAADTYRRHKLDALICIGGRETNQSALRLMEKGLNLINIPKAIDNDICLTDNTIGFNTALEVGAHAIDRLHSTALSHHRLIIVELMGRSSGWLTIGAGAAGGADVLLIPEIPYDIHAVSAAIMERRQAGKRFSILAVAEQITSVEQVGFMTRMEDLNTHLRTGSERAEVSRLIRSIEGQPTNTTFQLSRRLESITGLETRITILGYLLRGGTPSAADRLLATQMGTASINWVQAKQFGVMAASQNGQIVAVPIAEAGFGHKPMPLDHPWLESMRQAGINLGS